LGEGRVLANARRSMKSTGSPQLMSRGQWDIHKSMTGVTARISLESAHRILGEFWLAVGIRQRSGRLQCGREPNLLEPGDRRQKLLRRIPLQEKPTAADTALVESEYASCRPYTQMLKNCPLCCRLRLPAPYCMIALFFTGVRCKFQIIIHAVGRAGTANQHPLVNNGGWGKCRAAARRRHADRINHSGHARSA
jgi:hypothetical protein